MKRTLEITQEQAKELIDNDSELKKILLETFPELKNKVRDGWIIDVDSEIYEIEGYTDPVSDRNVFKQKKQAESALAYAQLTQLMAETGDCDVDWGHKNPKFCIKRENDKLSIIKWHNYYHFLAFNTYSVSEKFIKDNEDLIKQFFQIEQ